MQVRPRAHAGGGPSPFAASGRPNALDNSIHEINELEAIMDKIAFQPVPLGEGSQKRHLLGGARFLSYTWSLAGGTVRVVVFHPLRSCQRVQPEASMPGGTEAIPLGV